jgi:hypothetical protein
MVLVGLIRGFKNREHTKAFVISVGSPDFVRETGPRVMRVGKKRGIPG